jgi:Domain of unknown function DUF1828
MTEHLNLKKLLCEQFCSGISVTPVSAGYAIGTAFSDRSGDSIGFYISETDDGFKIEDDGDYLSTLIALGIPIDQGTRGHLLDSILSDSGAFWNRETYEISTNSFPESEISSKSIDFISSLIRVRDLELLTRDVIRSTFRDDATNAIMRAFQESASFEENVAASAAFSEFPADLIVRPNSSDGITGSVYFVNSNDKLNEALLLQMEMQADNDNSRNKVIALIEEPEMRLISRKKFQRAQNRSLLMPIFRGDEDAAMKKIARELHLLKTG